MHEKLKDQNLQSWTKGLRQIRKFFVKNPLSTIQCCLWSFRLMARKLGQIQHWYIVGGEGGIGNVRFKNKNVKKSVKTSAMNDCVLYISRMAKSLFWLMNTDILKVSNSEWSRWLGQKPFLFYAIFGKRTASLLKWLEKWMINTICMLFSIKAFWLFTSVPFTDCLVYFFFEINKIKQCIRKVIPHNIIFI